jgi:hypothetical protein
MKYRNTEQDWRMKLVWVHKGAESQIHGSISTIGEKSSCGAFNTLKADSIGHH